MEIFVYTLINIKRVVVMKTSIYSNVITVVLLCSSSLSFADRTGSNEQLLQEFNDLPQLSAEQLEKIGGQGNLKAFAFWFRQAQNSVNDFGQQVGHFVCSQGSGSCPPVQYQSIINQKLYGQ